MTAAGERFFVDTNVLVYWLDASDPAKQASARRWVAAVWERDAGQTSWQVLNEFYVNAVKKARAPLADVRTIVEVYAQWHPVGFGLGIVQRAWHWVDHAGVAYWDGLILSSAEAAACRYLLSEDFQGGRQYGRVQVVNPFCTDPSRFFGS